MVSSSCSLQSCTRIPERGAKFYKYSFVRLHLLFVRANVMKECARIYKLYENEYMKTMFLKECHISKYI